MSVPEKMHATCVAWGDRAVLIKGAAGTGKSALGLTLLAYGCQLVADDHVRLTQQDGVVLAHCPDTISGLIEARGLGILQAEVRPQAKVVLVVDLDQSETERLPKRRFFTVLGCNLPLIYRVDAPQFAPAILQTLKLGWSER